MTPDLCEVLAVVQEQLGEQLEMLDREGPAYVRALVVADSRPKTRQAPHGPAGMHPKMRQMVRELVSDELAVRRYYGPRRAS